MVDGTQFAVSEASRKKSEEGLTQQAIKAWQARATDAANGFGFDRWRMGKVAIQTGDPGRPQPMMRAMAFEAKAAPVAVEAGNTDVTVTVAGEALLDARRGLGRRKCDARDRVSPAGVDSTPESVGGHVELDPVLLSRLQFAFVIAFHILLPAFTVGLASYIVVARGHALLRRATSSTSGCRSSGPRCSPCRSVWASFPGIVMPFQFGTNWSRLTDTTGNVLGATSRLRRSHRILPRGRLSRHSAVRPQASAAVGSPVRRRDGRCRARCSRRSGSLRPTAGCRRRRATKSSTGATSRRIGSR